MIKFKTGYLSKETSNSLKGLFAIAVMVCHLFGKRGFGIDIGLGPIFTSLGYLSVAFFLFCTGYGLTISYISKGDDYLKGFLLRRVLPIYIINSILILVYSIYDMIIGDKISIHNIIQSFLFGDTVVKYGWYIQMIILFYVAFYLIAKFFNIKKLLPIFTAFIGLYCILCIIFDLGTTWYEGSLTFLLGIFWAKNKSKIDMVQAKKYYLLLALIVGVFTLTYLFGNLRIFTEPLRIFVKMVSAVAFVSMVLFIAMKIKFNYILTKFLGNYYFEFYLLQGLFISLFDEFIVINNTLLYCSTCLVCTLLSAIIVHPLVKFINSKCNLLANKRMCFQI